MIFNILCPKRIKKKQEIIAAVDLVNKHTPLIDIYSRSMFNFFLLLLSIHATRLFTLVYEFIIYEHLSIIDIYTTKPMNLWIFISVSILFFLFGMKVTYNDKKVKQKFEEFSNTSICVKRKWKWISFFSFLIIFILIFC
jgi:hypothetical protein